MSDVFNVYIYGLELTNIYSSYRKIWTRGYLQACLIGAETISLEKYELVLLASYLVQFLTNFIGSYGWEKILNLLLSNEASLKSLKVSGCSTW